MVGKKGVVFWAFIYFFGDLGDISDSVAGVTSVPQAVLKSPDKLWYHTKS